MQLDHARDTNANFDLFLTYSGMLDTGGLVQVPTPPLMNLPITAPCQSFWKFQRFAVSKSGTRQCARTGPIGESVKRFARSIPVSSLGEK